MNGQIVPLVCPQCGSPAACGLSYHTYGAEFKCMACGVVSVLVINHRLHIKNVGEHVCRQCGRVAPNGAKYCQCSASLVQKCTKCSHPFFIDDSICPECGWKAGVEKASSTGYELIAERIARFADQKDWAALRSELGDMALACNRANKEPIEIYPVLDKLLSEAFGQESHRNYLENKRDSLVKALESSLKYSHSDNHQCDGVVSFARVAKICERFFEIRANAKDIASVVEICRISEDYHSLILSSLIYGLKESKRARTVQILDLLTRSCLHQGEAKYDPKRPIEIDFSRTLILESAMNTLGKLGAPALSALDAVLFEPNYSLNYTCAARSLHSLTLSALVEIGTPALPVLRKHTGFFAGNSDLKSACKGAIQEIQG